MNGIESIAAERKRQVESEGWTPEHDDEHDAGEMAAAAFGYTQAALCRIGRPACAVPSSPAFWPWSLDWWKPKDARADLVRAGALIAAEIDRLDRAAARQSR